LRAAIQETNRLAGADTIILPAGTYILTIPGTGEDRAATGDLDISDDLTIEGAGAANTVIDGARLDRVFDIGGGTTTPIDVRISGVTVRNGQTSDDFFDGEGGAIRFGANLTISDATISGNSALTGGGGIGAALPTAFFPDFILTLTNTIVSDNRIRAIGSGGGIDAQNASGLSIFNSIIRDNVAFTGAGGVAAGGGAAVLTEVTISGNQAIGGNAGGIDGVRLFITRSTISGNTSNGTGGGVVGGGTITNSTISGNTARTGGGGLLSSSADGLTLNNVTIADNSVVTAGGAGGLRIAANITVGNTIISSRSLPNCDTFVGGTLSITSAGHNLVTDSTCNLTMASDQLTMNPLLDPLADNGGPTQTHALRPGSPAIDAGNPATPGSGGNACEPTDQRRLNRSADDICDIGAFELGAQPLQVVNPLVTFEPRPATFRTTTDTMGCPFTPQFQGKFSFSALLTNQSATPLSDLVIEVTTLSGGNLLQTEVLAQSSVGWVGAIVAVPPDGAPRHLDPGQSNDVPFVICLLEIQPFRFFVDILGR
jgi:hypothetical protein